MSELDHQLHCATRPILPAVFVGGAVEAFSMYRGMPFNPRAAALTAGVVYGYVLHASSIIFTTAERTRRFELVTSHREWQIPVYRMFSAAITF